MVEWDDVRDWPHVNPFLEMSWVYSRVLFFAPKMSWMDFCSFIGRGFATPQRSREILEILEAI